MFFSQNFPGSLKLPVRPARLVAVLTALLFPALLTAQNPPTWTLLDPVPALLKGPRVTGDANTLATKGRMVQGSSADGASEVVVRIIANAVGEHLTLTIINDQGQQSVSATEDGGLGKIGSASFASSQITVRAVNTSKGPMAFAIYGAPVDFPRPEGQDVDATDRFITLGVLDVETGLSGSQGVTLLRPPVALIHGLWGSPDSWDNFTPFITDPRFAIGRTSYAGVIGGKIMSYEPTYPAFAIPSLKNAQANSLGFAYNAPHVLKQLATIINHFKSGKNPEHFPVTAVQVDIVAHSMGGDITRTFPLVKGFYGKTTFGLGGVHKLITIGTPHWGSPLAIHMVDSDNECVRGVLATSGAPSFTSVTFNDGTTVSGAVGDLQGDGFGGSLSPALLALQTPIPHPLPSALIQGVESQSQLDGLDSSPNAQAIRALCFGDYLATHLTSTGWPQIFNQDSDSIVPALSAVAGLSDFTEVDGVIHSSSAELLGFGPPAELDEAGDIPITVTNLLNTPVTNAVFVGLPQ